MWRRFPLHAVGQHNHRLAVQLWQGDASLIRTHWLLGVLPGIALNVVLLLYSNQVQLAKFDGLIPTCLLLIAGLIYFSFIYIVLWKCAKGYKGLRCCAFVAQYGATPLVLGILFVVLCVIDVSSRFSDIQLNKIASSTNQRLPRLVNEFTVLDSVTTKEKTLTYHYVVLGVTSSEIDQSDAYKQLRTQLLGRLCSTRNVKDFLAQGITISERYTGTDNAEIVTIDIKASDCGT